MAVQQVVTTKTLRFGICYNPLMFTSRPKRVMEGIILVAAVGLVITGTQVVPSPRHVATPKPQSKPAAPNQGGVVAVAPPAPAHTNSQQVTSAPATNKTSTPNPDNVISNVNSPTPAPTPPAPAAAPPAPTQRPQVLIPFTNKAIQFLTNVLP
jgi:hypothetical protein